MTEKQLQKLIDEHMKDFGTQYLAFRILHALKKEKVKRAKRSLR